MQLANLGNPTRCLAVITRVPASGQTGLVLVLTRERVRPYLARVTVAPITSTIRGLSTEVQVGDRG